MSSTQTFEESLDRNSFAPLYHQLYEVIRNKIDSGFWKPGDMIPTEAELNKEFGVSQITIRKALDMLVESGLIYRQRGKGTFVAKRVTISNVTHLVTFAEDMRSRGFSFRTELVETDVVPVSKHTAGLLNMEVGDELVKIERLRFADEEPLSVEKSFLVHKLFPGILRHDFSIESLRDVLSNNYGVNLTRAQQTIRAQTADDELASSLSISPGDPVLFIERVVYSQNDIPVEFLRMFYRADRYELQNEVKRDF